MGNVPESKADLDTWRKHIECRVDELQHKIDANTVLTAAVSEKVETLTANTKPIVDAMDTMQTGIRVIGKIGTTAGTVSKWTFRAGLLFTALWVAGKIVFGGGSLTDASVAFWKVLSIGH